MIYAIQAEGTEFVKFGLTGHSSVNNRLRDLQVASPFNLVVLAVAYWPDSHERRIHNRLSDYWVRGEWFTISPLALEVISDMREGIAWREIPDVQPNPPLFASTHKRLGKALDYSFGLVSMAKFGPASDS